MLYKATFLLKAKVILVNYYRCVERVNYTAIFEKITGKDRKMGIS